MPRDVPRHPKAMNRSIGTTFVDHNEMTVHINTSHYKDRAVVNAFKHLQNNRYDGAYRAYVYDNDSNKSLAALERESKTRITVLYKVDSQSLQPKKD